MLGATTTSRDRYAHNLSPVRIAEEAVSVSELKFMPSFWCKL